MNRKEFLDELENALAGRLNESDIREITSDYGDIFANGAENGKSEEAVAAELGSPARIARTILEDNAGNGSSGGPASRRGGGDREYTDFQKNINEKTSKLFDKVIEPDRNVDVGRLASMSRRLGAYVIDGILLGVIVMGGIFALLVPLFMYSARTEMTGYSVNGIPAGDMMIHMNEPGYAALTNFSITGIMGLFLVMGAFNLFTTVILWATNGYTPGKYILKIRVVKISGSKLSFLDALLRELAIKCVANSIVSGFLNLGSFIWGCVTEDHKTVHDLAAQTRVVEWDRTQK